MSSCKAPARRPVFHQANLPAMVAGASALVVFAGFWLVLPLAMRRTEPSTPQESEPPTP